jgi:hypothetical protein
VFGWRCLRDYLAIKGQCPNCLNRATIADARTVFLPKVSPGPLV